MTLQITSLKPLKPTLYQLANDGKSLEFIYASCNSCKRLTFPANAPGCMHCGLSIETAEKLTRKGIGTLMEFVTVHVPLTPDMEVPCIIGDILLEDGIIEEVVISVHDESTLALGMSLKAIASPLQDGSAYTCRFTPNP
jgi:uncharacterized OB-fold protein